MPSRLHLLALLVATALLGACSGSDSGDHPDTETGADSTPTAASETENGSESAPAAVMDSTAPPPARMTLEQAVEAARKDLVERAGSSMEAIEVVEARVVTWNDGSMGCPEPGMAYTQALVPGFFIHLRDANGDVYYHAGRSGQPFHCPEARRMPPMDPGDLG
ncbi:hypothetical protein [Wenzhouxiangella marina]|uniref:Uncharacterized protein n=1 Tax=Wenzhouxiangella marina TaxID=1579979 RepID=A0A0K0XZP2_9GAMM|nr:hypothetical protein [Wenzhouxiangella marina]AKS43091.1 hypothetical protein WM2015_2733 [Wenzhouxiangella marina]MBB6087225.1 hypothetical protein [Wenzhouxiangella marina]